MKKAFYFFVLVVVIFLLFGCEKKKNSIKDISIDGGITEFGENFLLSDIILKVNMTDGQIEYVPLTSDMISIEDLQKLNTIGTHEINVKYLNNATTFTITVKGEKGEPGAKGNPGEKGEPGVDGKEIELQVVDGYIKWKYKNESTWNNLIALADLKGQDGTNGKDGTNPTIDISEDGFWIINGVKTTHKASWQNEVQYNTISFELNGGILPDGYLNNEILVEKGTTLDLPVPNKEGYVFIGWFTGFSVNDAQFTNISVVTNNLTLYAKWEEDNTDLYNFFNTPFNDSYRIIIEMNSNIQIDQITKTNSIIMFHQIYKHDDVINAYHYLHIKNTDYDEEYLADDVHYDVYFDNLNYKLFYSYFLDEWDVVITPDQYEKIDLFEYLYLNLENFTKRDGENIYEYKINIDYLNQISRYLDIVNDYSGEIIFNPEENILLFDLTLYGTYNGSENSEHFTCAYVIVPPEEIELTEPKQIANFIINESIRIKNNYHYCTDESLATLSSIVNTITDNIYNCETLLELIETVDSAKQTINEFELVYDELKHDKFLAKNELTEYYNNLCETATSQSIYEMGIIYHDYLKGIELLPSNEGIANLISHGKLAIEEKYIPIE